MIQTVQNARGVVPVDSAADVADPVQVAKDASPAPAEGNAAGEDPVARFSAMNGLHADVRERAGTQYVGTGATKGAQTQAAGKNAPSACIRPHAGAYDVATTTQAQIDALKRLPVSAAELKRLKHASVDEGDLARLARSRNPKERELAATIVQDRRRALDMEGQVRLGWTIENAKIAYADLIASHGSVIATTSEANGGQPVLTLTGPKFNCDQPATVHTHYHGDNATVADPVGSKAGTTSRIMSVLQGEDPQAVFVLPEASNAPFAVDSPENHNKNDYVDVNWRNVTSQAETTKDALAAAGVAKVGEQVVSFHSGGGKVVPAIMKHDPSGQGIKANRLELYDCLYGNWQDSFAKWAKTADPKTIHTVVYFHGTNDRGQGDAVAKAFGDKFWKVDMADQGKIDPKRNPVYHGAHNETYPRNYPERHNGKDTIRRDFVRNFHENPHYRTVGEFFASRFDLRYL